MARRPLPAHHPLRKKKRGKHANKVFPKMGRPPIDPADRKSHQIVVRVDGARFAFLEKEAKRMGEGATISDVIRALVDTRMKRTK